MRSQAPSERIPVLFIAGTGRSGSTILDRVIGMNSGFCSLGEMRNIWKLSFRDNHLCGCGAPFLECEFWNEVCRRAFGVAAPEVDAEEMLRLQRSVDRVRYVPWLTSARSPAAYRRALSEYGGVLTRLYGAALAVSGKRVLVDSTKDPTQALLLSRLPAFEVRAVHLVRDPRATAFSWQRVRQHPGVHSKRQHMEVYPARSSAARWTFYNGLSELLSRSAASYLRVRYEDLLAEPEEVLSRVIAPYQPEGGAPVLAESDRVDLAPSHTVSGNPVRFQHGKLKLKVDDEWKAAMPARDKAVVSAITLPLLLRYGYRLGTAT